ncbi:uncharacterized protein LOC127004777 [Eriocheir sinensis]|uniref:uncharacterized protein LOC127004777 n=1 Tax=Eriocheir sinensis TaxID=95602 RepID=UPI0021C97B7D|nr:uncharacterized protein LOC127004777 [Eriocheir sinensis]
MKGMNVTEGSDESVCEGLSHFIVFASRNFRSLYLAPTFPFVTTFDSSLLHCFIYLIATLSASFLIRSSLVASLLPYFRILCRFALSFRSSAFCFITTSQSLRAEKLTVAQQAFRAFPPLARLRPQPVARLLPLLPVAPRTLTQFSDYPDESTVFVHLEDPGPALLQPPRSFPRLLVTVKSLPAVILTSTASPTEPSSSRQLYYDFLTVYIEIKLLYITAVSTRGCEVLAGCHTTSTASPTEPSSSRQLYYFTAGYLEVELFKAVHLHYCSFSCKYTYLKTQSSVCDPLWSMWMEYSRTCSDVCL